MYKKFQFSKHQVYFKNLVIDIRGEILRLR